MAISTNSLDNNMITITVYSSPTNPTYQNNINIIRNHKFQNTLMV